jgi:hypothetical protein
MKQSWKFVIKIEIYVLLDLNLQFKPVNKKLKMHLRQPQYLKSNTVAILLAHKGYYQLAIVFEKQKRYSEAIYLCKKAKSQGW